MPLESPSPGPSSLHPLHPPAPSESSQRGSDCHCPRQRCACPCQFVGRTLPEGNARQRIDFEEERPMTAATREETVIGQISEKEFGEQPLHAEEHDEERKSRHHAAP